MRNKIVFLIILLTILTNNLVAEDYKSVKKEYNSVLRNYKAMLLTDNLFLLNECYKDFLVDNMSYVKNSKTFLL